MSARRQHLSDDVFYNKAFVDFQFVEEQLFVALFTDNPVYQTSGWSGDRYRPYSILKSRIVFFSCRWYLLSQKTRFLTSWIIHENEIFIPPYFTRKQDFWLYRYYTKMRFFITTHKKYAVEPIMKEWFHGMFSWIWQYFTQFSSLRAPIMWCL